MTVAPCAYDAARYAVENWHYSKIIPAFRLVHFGCWEGDRFVGTIVFSRGASPYLGDRYGLTSTECVELVRVAMREHEHPVTEAVAEALRLLRSSSPGLRLVMSFADTSQGHVGRIYQAGNWLYLGQSDGGTSYIVNGKRYLANALSRKRLRHRQGGVPAESCAEWARKVLDPNMVVVPEARKHRYAMPLDRAMRRQLTPLALPYPTE